METVKAFHSFGGVQGYYRHDSEACGGAMELTVFQPPGTGPFPVVYFLSGLTCTPENFTTKAGAQRLAAELGLLVVAPDTSPRGAGCPGEDDDWDFGTGAGFYVDATREPWSRHYRMYTYVVHELPGIIEEHFPTLTARGVLGHSMGGHGALVAALRNPGRFRSVSAFAPICAPSRVPWGQKAFSRYLGEDRAEWKRYDACELVKEHRHPSRILIDQGSADGFLEEQLLPQRFEEACNDGGQDVELRMREGYDHSYFFVASFLEDHLRHHAEQLRADP